MEPDHLTGSWTAGGALPLTSVLYAPLVTLNGDGSLNYVQADSIKSTDGVVWTVKIKPGWTFHNGDPVTAQSYVDGINTAAYGPNAFGKNSDFIDVVGYDKLNPAEGKPSSTTLDGLKVIDDTTFQVTLTHVNQQLPNQMSDLGWTPLPKVAMKDLKAYDEAPIGDGPYEMDGAWQHNVEIKLKRYAEYKGPAGKASNLDYKIYSTSDAAYTDAVAGNVDILGDGFSLPPTKLPALKSDFSDRVFTPKATSITYIAFPLWDARFDDVRVRQAVSMAIDRPTISKQIYGGLYPPATGILAPALIGGLSNDSCGQYCGYDVDAAKALLAQAGGFKGTMTFYVLDNFSALGQAVANEVRQNLGIDVDLKTLPDFTQWFAALQKKNWTGPFPSGWGPSVATPTDTLNGLFKTGATYNITAGGYHTPATDSLINAGDAATTAAAGQQAYLTADKAIMADMPVAPIVWPLFPVAYSSRVGNLKAGASGWIDLSQVTIK